MTDVCTVHNCLGVPLDELPVTVPRGDNLARTVNADRGFFGLPVTHPKATLRNLRNGNIAYIQSDQAGIRPWAALIQEPEPTGTEVVNGELSIKLRGAEYILATRYTASKDIITGSPGSCIAQLVYFARREGFIPVSVDMTGIDMSGKPIGPLEYNDANIYEAINKIVTDAGGYWWMQPIITSDNKLILKVFFVYQRTRIFPIALKSTGAKANLSIKTINQSGELWNHVKAYARSESWDRPVEYEEKNTRSIGYYNNTYTKVISALEETTVAGLVPIVQSFLAIHSFPLLKIDGIVHEPPFPRVGDVCTVYLTSYGGLITSRRGPIVQMVVESTMYSPQDTSLAVQLTEVINA
jgi:hypothetical protein